MKKIVDDATTSNNSQQQHHEQEANVSFFIQGATISNDEDEPMEMENICNYLPTLSQGGHVQVRLDMADICKEYNITIPQQSTATTLHYQQVFLYLQELNAQWQHIAQEIATSQAVVQAVMRRIQSKVLFANLGHDVIAKIFEYCCSLPVERLLKYGYEKYEKIMHMQYERKRDHTVLKKNVPIWHDKRGNLMPCCFALICKAFADAMQSRAYIIIANSKLLPKEQYVSRFKHVHVLHVRPLQQVVHHLSLMKSTQCYAFFRPDILHVDCAINTSNLHAMLSWFQPITLQVENLNKWHENMIIPQSVQSLVINRNDVSSILYDDCLCKHIASAMQLRRVEIYARIITRQVLDLLLSIDHLQTIYCCAITDIPNSEIPQLIEAFKAKQKMLTIGIPYHYPSDNPFGLRRDVKYDDDVCPHKYAYLLPYQAKGHIHHCSALPLENEVNRVMQDMEHDKRAASNTKKRLKPMREYTDERPTKKPKVNFDSE